MWAYTNLFVVESWQNHSLFIQLQEFTDVDILHESEEGAEDLINALAEAEAPALLLHNLARLDEQVPDERDAVHNTLGICLIFFLITFIYCWWWWVSSITRADRK